jgi:hypothetical protein
VFVKLRVRSKKRDGRVAQDSGKSWWIQGCESQVERAEGNNARWTVRARHQ